MNQREITADVVHILPYFTPATTRVIAKRAGRRNADVCALLRSIGGCFVARGGVMFRVERNRKGYRAPIDSASGMFGGTLDLSQEFSDVIQEVEADSRFGLFLGGEDRAA